MSTPAAGTSTPAATAPAQTRFGSIIAAPPSRVVREPATRPEPRAYRPLSKPVKLVVSGRPTAGGRRPRRTTGWRPTRRAPSGSQVARSRPCRCTRSVPAEARVGAAPSDQRAVVPPNRSGCTASVGVRSAPRRADRGASGAENVGGRPRDPWAGFPLPLSPTCAGAGQQRPATGYRAGNPTARPSNHVFRAIAVRSCAASTPQSPTRCPKVPPRRLRAPWRVR